MEEQKGQEINKRQGVAFIIFSVVGSLGLSAIGMLAGLLFMVLMARWYGPATVGRYGLMQTAIQMCLLVGMLGTNRSLIRFVAVAEQQGRRLALVSFWLIILPVGLLLSFLLFVSSGFLAQRVFSDPALQRYYQVGALTLLFAMIASFWSSFHHGRRAVMYSVTLREVLPLGVGAFLMVVLALRLDLLAEPAIFHAFGWFVSACVGGVGWYIYVSKNSRMQVLAVSVREAIRASIPMLLASASFLILGWTDTLMLGIFHDAETVGIYRVGFKVSFFITIGAQAVRKLASPRIAGAFSIKDEVSLRRWITWASLANVLLVWPLGILVWFIPFWLLSFFDHGFEAAAPIMLILCGGEMARALFGMPIMVLEMLGHAKSYQTIMLFAAGLNVLLNLILVPRFAGEGAALATVVSCVFSTFVVSRLAGKYYGESISVFGIIMRFWQERKLA